MTLSVKNPKKKAIKILEGIRFMNKGMIYFFIAFVALVGFSLNSVALDQNQNTEINHIDQVFYKVSLKVTKEGDVLTGTEFVRFNSTAKKEVPELVYPMGLIVVAELNGQSVLVKDSQVKSLRLPKNILKIGQNELFIRFKQKYKNDGVGIRQFDDKKDGAKYLFSYQKPNQENAVFPTFQTKNLKTKWALNVEAPETWQIVSSHLESIVTFPNRGRKLWVFPETQELSPHLFSIVAGPFKVLRSKVGDVTLRLFTRQSVSENIDEQQIFAVSKSGFTFYKEYFEQNYPFKKLDQVLMPELDVTPVNFNAIALYNEQDFNQKVPLKLVLKGLARVWRNVQGDLFDEIVISDAGNLLQVLEAQKELEPNFELKSKYSQSFYQQLKKLSSTKDASQYERLTVGMVPVKCNTPKDLDRLESFISNNKVLPSVVVSKLNNAKQNLRFCQGQ
ncbi:hypothetical protein BVY03_05975 [bacterium K02(2017)]|nr:hypothetical protein BVY03_05975 [bacterium K02(2017)]